jgi:hypothetical protein
MRIKSEWSTITGEIMNVNVRDECAGNDKILLLMSTLANKRPDRTRKRRTHVRGGYSKGFVKGNVCGIQFFFGSNSRLVEIVKVCDKSLSSGLFMADP